MKTVWPGVTFERGRHRGTFQALLRVLEDLNNVARAVKKSTKHSRCRRDVLPGRLDANQFIQETTRVTRASFIWWSSSSWLRAWKYAGLWPLLPVSTYVISVISTLCTKSTIERLRIYRRLLGETFLRCFSFPSVRGNEHVSHFNSSKSAWAFKFTRKGKGLILQWLSGVLG